MTVLSAFLALPAGGAAAQQIQPAPMPFALPVGTEMVIDNNGRKTVVTITAQRPGATVRRVEVDDGKTTLTVVQPNNPFVPYTELAMPGQPVEKGVVSGDPDEIFPLTTGRKTSFQMKYPNRTEDWRCEVTGNEPYQAAYGGEDTWVVVCIQSEQGNTIQTVRRNYAPTLGVAVIGTYRRHDSGATGRNQLVTMKRPS